MAFAPTAQAPSTMDFIHRLLPTTDQSPPWAGIEFKDPVESDELSDKLKEAFPKVRTLRGRKHLAAIMFLTQEFRDMNANGSAEIPLLEEVLNAATPSSQPSGYTSPSASGSMHSPRVADQVKASAGACAEPEQPQHFAPGRNPQLLVWSAHDGRSRRPKTKRKMTQEERDAYKKTRERGACDKCRKQKGRCTHVNDGEAPPVAADKAAKPPKRRNSTGFDMSQPGKVVKAEPQTDVHHSLPGRSNSFANSTTTQQTIPAQLNGSTSLPVNSVPSNGQWDARLGREHETQRSGYVYPHPGEPFDVNLSQGREPWSPHTARNAMEPILSGRSGGSRNALSPALPTPDEPVDFFFRDDFYTGQWTDTLGQSMESSELG